MPTERKVVVEGAGLLRNWLKEHDLTHREFAKMLGIAEQTISSWLRCTRRPSGDQRTAIELLTKKIGKKVAKKLGRKVARYVRATEWRTPEEQQALQNVA